MGLGVLWPRTECRLILLAIADRAKNGIDNSLNKTPYLKDYKINPMPFFGEIAIVDSENAIIAWCCFV